MNRKSLLLSNEGDEETHGDAKSETHEQAEEKESWEDNQITKLDDLVLLFPGLNIPYFCTHPD